MTIAIDASSFRRYLDRVDAHACELLSDPNWAPDAVTEVQSVAVVPINRGFWHRAGFKRAKLIRTKLKPRLPGTLIAQSCIDYGIPLITNDGGFRQFASFGLKLL
jgi:predicted nucleic acid-binding protein